MYRWCAIVLVPLLLSCESSREPARELARDVPEAPTDSSIESSSLALRGDSLAVRPELQAVFEAAVGGRVDELLTYFDAADPSVRARAAFDAAKVDDPRVVAPLVELLADSESAVRADAAFALARVRADAETLSEAAGNAGGSPAGVAPADGSLRSVLAALLGRLAVEPVDAVRHEIYSTLGLVGDSSASRALLGAGDSAGRDERSARTRALARMWGRGVVVQEVRDALVARLTDPNAAVREAAARGFASARGPDVWIRYRRPVAEAIDGYDLDDEAARPILLSFGRLLPRASLERWWRSAVDPRTRRAAVLAVTSHSDGMLGSADLMTAFADPHPWVRHAAAIGLAQVAGSNAAVAALEADIGPRPDPVTEEAWLRALAASGRLDELYDRVEGYAPDDEVGWSAAAALVADAADPILLDIFSEAEASSSRYVAWLASRARGSGDASSPEDLDDGLLPDWSDDDWAELAALGPQPTLRLPLANDTVIVQLDPDQAPSAVLYLARRLAAGTLEMASVHRLLPGVLAQWGPPGATADGPLPEPGRIRFEQGVVGWALREGRGDDDLFVALDDLHELDGAYTAIGWVVGGQEAWVAAHAGLGVGGMLIATP